MLNEYFHSAFSPAQSQSNQQPEIRSPSHTLDEIQLTTSEVYKALCQIDPNKASGIDNIPGKLLKELASEISPSIAKVFNISLSSSYFFQKWKMANVFPIHKKDYHTLTQNYRPISLLCILSKVFERCVFNYSFLSSQLYHQQHGFQRGKSTTSQLLLVYQEIVTSLSKGNEVDVIYLDFTNAFD